MTLCKRLIARLDIKGSRLIKGIRFEGLRVVGDPRQAALNYSLVADELLYIDAVASLYGRNGLANLLRITSREVFIPITAGGGVRCVGDAAELLAAGADKIAVNTAALRRPELITELVEAFGSQCIVASIQARSTGQGTWECMAESGRERSSLDVLEWMERVQQLGVGEILLTSVDQDGTCAGPDQKLQLAASAVAKVPLLIGGGFSSTVQVLDAFEVYGVAGVSIGAALHRNQLELSLLKDDLASASPTLPIRHAPINTGISRKAERNLAGKRIGVVDYGMGNQQSLINAFQHLGAETLLSSKADELQNCELIALPGVGAFPEGMAQLEIRDLKIFLSQWAKEGRPLIGICLGMQMLFEKSEEFKITSGLGLLQGQVKAIPSYNEAGEPVILPHVGWNQLIPGNRPFEATKISLSNQYFVHSFVAMGVDPKAILFNFSYSKYTFVAAVQQGSVVGFQFHPERSGKSGLALIEQKCVELLQLSS
jgi:imidazole glycerol phosphate synthase glutamine amidotransferase subunit